MQKNSSKNISENPKVFTDFHHASLLNSFILLFEKRFGGSVYRPIGMDWATEGYWKVYEHPATQQQYLTMAQGYKPEDGTLPLNNIEKYEDGVYYCQDIDSGYYNKAITLEKFINMEIDIIIASLPQHVQPFLKLQQRFKPNAKLIYQIGNNWNIEGSMMITNIMSSALVNIPEWYHSIVYHQEFDREIFFYREPVPQKNIYSFINCYNVEPHFQKDWELFQRLEARMTDWTFRSYGGQCRDGSRDGSRKLASAMGNSRFIWHSKFGGDGYGHILFNSASVGRPIITKMDYYRGKLGEKLLIDGETCILIDNMDEDAIIRKIEYYNQDDNYRQLVYNVRNNFQLKVNFDHEEIRLRKFIDELK